MHQLFNFRRFGLLFRKHTAEHYKYYLMATIVLSGLLFLILLFVDRNRLGANLPPLPAREQEAWFIVTLLLSGSLFTSTIFNDYGNHRKAIGELLLPASSLEKYAVKWVYSWLIYQVIFAFAFYLALFLLGSWYEYRYAQSFDYLQITDLFSSTRDVMAMWFIYAFLHAVMLWGSITFKKWQFIKTGLVLILTILLLSFLNYLLVGSILHKFGNLVTYFPFGNITIGEGAGETQIVRSGPEWRYFPYLVFLVMSGFFWVISYFKLKEKQI
jgi:hypothetical protein